MTVETCLRLAEHFKKIGRLEDAKTYEERAAKKAARHPEKYKPVETKSNKVK